MNWYKVSLVATIASAITSIALGIISLNDARKGRKKMHEDDLECIANSVAGKLKDSQLSQLEVN